MFSNAFICSLRKIEFEKRYYWERILLEMLHPVYSVLPCGVVSNRSCDAILVLAKALSPPFFSFPGTVVHVPFEHGFTACHA